MDKQQGKYDDVLRPFLALMEAELHANAGKGDRPGWLSMTRQTALLEIYYHVAKLQKAAKNDDAALIREHAADVANMAMMLLDVCGGLPAAPQPPSASDKRDYPAVTYAKAFRFLGSLANPLFETKFVGDAAHSSEIPNDGLVRFAQALIDEDRAALAPSPGVDAAEQKPVPFRLGNEYQTQSGEWVRFVSVSNAGTVYESMADENGVHRYTTRDYGRVTGTAHDYSDPLNTPPLYAAPSPAASAEPHPPSRACMCADCQPSFDNGADDPTRRYDITRGGANG
ncbi:hypothetical protein GCM10007242_41170 [Pigmentiphaga litoralis]|uniref:hypothetical protein n=1 Tax=Pigmentiphaga litoralis TaxID=516702 RepID=UPI001676E38B|nr:hypothetical protein [Pigmentiphaga litoralis]GGX30333.1 hypothetical protein GCM10007242_41170 [Pigmentiphaga litoralis]